MLGGVLAGSLAINLFQSGSLYRHFDFYYEGDRPIGQPIVDLVDMLFFTAQNTAHYSLTIG